MKPKLIAAAVALSAGVIAVTGCSSDADVVSKNLSKESDQFKIDRRVVFFNGITDKYLLSIEGKCSIKDENNQLEVTCKTGDDEYKKHFLGLSDNVSYFVEQLESAEVSRYHYKVIFKPETILPDVDRP
ncbi:beta-sandwich lipoprotein [Nocardia sp. NPDC055029]|uniref:beta-sandwich lipoprotein n=1 Tax=Nocardia sp. NPDC060259 TaxID=3347088 RepID=UPI0036514CDD